MRGAQCSLFALFPTLGPAKQSTAQWGLTMPFTLVEVSHGDRAVWTCTQPQCFKSHHRSLLFGAATLVFEFKLFMLWTTALSVI